jgi:hypothetical protein
VRLPRWLADGVRHGLPDHQELLDCHIAELVRERDRIADAQDGSCEAALDLRDANLRLCELQALARA